MKRAEITTAQLSEMSGIGSRTIRRMAEDLGGIPAGGRRGWLFPASAPQQLIRELRDRHSNANHKGKGRK